MTNLRFINALRDYAALARKRHISYAEQIDTLVALRQAEAVRAARPDADLTAIRDEIQRIADREYGKYDDKYLATTID